MESLAEILEKPKAIVIFSAHWFSHEMEITLKETSGNERTSTPLFSASYHGNYPIHQPKWLTDRIVTLLHENNVTHSTSHRALDHDAWSVLALSYPGTDIPVIGMSLPIYQDLKDYFALGTCTK